VPPLPDVPTKELLKNVVEMKRPKVSAPLPPPPEAAGEDLLQQPAVIDKPPVRKTAAKGPAPGTPMEEPPSYTRANRRRRNSLWIDWGVVGLLSVLLFAVVLALSRHMMLAKESEPPITEPAPLVEFAPEPVVLPAAEPAPVEPVQPAEVPAPPPPQEIEKKKVVQEKPLVKDVAPTELLLSVQTLGGNKVKIDLRTDAAGDYPVYVQIVGLPGQVAEGASFYKFMKINPKGDRREPLDLSGLNLPQGRFILRAETGSLKKEARMNVGVTEPQFKQNVARLRKMYAFAIWKERLELFRLIQIMDKRLTEALAGKKFNAKGLEALSAVKRTNGANYILYDQWFEAKEILAEARTAPSMALLGRLKQAREKLSTFSVWK